MKHSLLAPLCMLAVLAAAAPASAHHSGTMYDRSPGAMKHMKGVVKVFAWTNPHCTLTFVADAVGGKPGEEWTTELTSPGVLTRAGWSKRTFKPGDRIEIDVAPLRGGGPAGSFVRATLVETGQTLSPAGG